MSAIDHEKNIIEVAGVSFSYSAQEVLTDISLQIHQGDYLGIIGPNGAGKTTLLKIMLGLLAPSHGSVRLFGVDIKKFNDWPRIGYVPQKVTTIDANFPATVREAVLMGRYGRAGLLHGMATGDKNMTIEALRHVGMEEYADRLIGDLSGGQQQRVFIARALASEPDVMFLDEPTTGVDQNTQDEFYALLRKLNDELHLTLVLISHDIERVAAEAMHIACIDRVLVCHTSPEQFLMDSASRDMFGHQVKIINHNHRSE